MHDCAVYISRDGDLGKYVGLVVGGCSKERGRCRLVVRQMLQYVCITKQIMPRILPMFTPCTEQASGLAAWLLALGPLFSCFFGLDSRRYVE